MDSICAKYYFSAIMFGDDNLGYLMGIDAGTTSLKAVLYDEEGNTVAVGRSEYNIETPQPGMAELNAEDYWNACREAILKVMRASNVNPAEVEAIAISSQGETFIPVDRDGNPLRRAIVWLDNRSGDESRIIEKHFGVDNIFKVTGQPQVVPTWPATKILWLKRNEPRIFAETYKYLLVEDFLLYKLTGIFSTEYSVVSSTLMFDICREDWWDEMLEVIGISRDHLPELNPSGKPIGNISDSASKATGLSTKTIVSTGAFDQAAGAVGSANVKPGIITETTGAALALLATINEPVYDPKHRVPCHHHALPGKFFLLPWCQTAGIVFRWFRDEFGKYEAEVADKMGVDAYDLLTLEASGVKAGSNGLIILPHFAGAGPPEFDPDARGVIFGLTLSHGRAHLIRAILESIAYMLRRNIELIEEFGVRVKEIRSLGGASKSPLWNQIKADVTSKVILTLQTSEAASLGAAILAGVACGRFKCVEDGCDVMVRLKERYEPNLENRKIYDRYYRVYLSLYEKLRDLFPAVSQ